MAAAGGIDNPNLGGHKSMTVAFAPDDPHDPSLPGHARRRRGRSRRQGDRRAGHSTASPSPPTRAPTSASSTTSATTLTDQPRDARLRPLGAAPGLRVHDQELQQDPRPRTRPRASGSQAYAGSPDDVIAGEAALGLTRIPAISEQNIPEPATLLAWSLVAGGAVGAPPVASGRVAEAVWIVIRFDGH